MARDVEELLERAAHVPDDPLDVTTLVRGGRALRRRRQAVRGLALAVLLLAVPGGMVGLGYARSHQITPVDQPRVTTPPAPTGPEPVHAPNPVRPRTPAEGADTVMPVTFLDGTTAEIVYPEALDLAGLGLRPGGAAELAGCCARDFFLPAGGEGGFASTGRPLQQPPGVRGPRRA